RLHRHPDRSDRPGNARAAGQSAKDSGTDLDHRRGNRRTHSAAPAGALMKWVTRKRIRVNRTATAWLIRRFVDPQAEFLFVEPKQIARAQEELGAKGFDAPGATYPHQDAQGRCSIEALVDEHCPGDAPLKALARIV